MDLRTFLLDAHGELRSKLEDSVMRVVPEERWTELADGGGSSVAWLLLHLARHHDLALTTCIRDHPPLFEARRDALGLTGSGPGAGMTEREDRDVTLAVDRTALRAFVTESFDASHRWLEELSLMALDVVPDTARRLAQHAHLPVDGFGWLYRMWSDRTVGWFVQWPMLGHGNNHLGEAISVRNRMGLSPF
jgi:hypothetical protein